MRQQKFASALPEKPLQFRIGARIVTFQSFSKGKQYMNCIDESGKIVRGHKSKFKAYTPEPKPLPCIIELRNAWSD